METIKKIQRFPSTSNRSLKAWSAADEHLLKNLESEILPASSITILNDRFGYLSVHLAKNNPTIITHFKSQEDAIKTNFEQNEIDAVKNNFSHLTDDRNIKSDFVLIKIPKSMNLFHFFVMKAHALSKSNTKVFCGFMTRHFTKQMITIASQYFDNVDQGLAWKKSRVLTLSSPKTLTLDTSPITSIPFVNHRGENLEFSQYFGVFSGNHIDYATQFLIENITVDTFATKALDLASGNGVIACEIRAKSKNIEIHLMDDSQLAIESSKLNLKEGNNIFHYDYSLDHFEDQFFDLIVSNPPFHFEHENTIEIALQLFKEVSRILKSDGEFLLVANLHLNYKTHLVHLFEKVEVINMNSKFEVLKCKN